MRRSGKEDEEGREREEGKEETPEQEGERDRWDGRHATAGGRQRKGSSGA